MPDQPRSLDQRTDPGQRTEPDRRDEPDVEARAGEPDQARRADRVAQPEPAEQPAPADEPPAPAEGEAKPAEVEAKPRATGPGVLWRALRAKPDRGQVVVALLVGALAFTTVLQVRTDEEDLLEGARRSDLAQIWSNLSQRSERLEQEIADLRVTRRELLTGVDAEEALLEQTSNRAGQLAVLSGTAPARGPGIVMRIPDPTGDVGANQLLSAVQELRVAGAEAIQLEGSLGGEVRISTSTYFLDSERGVDVDGVVLSPPYLLTAIGEPSALHGSMRFAGGIDEIADGAEIEEREFVQVDVLRSPSSPQYARPAPDEDE